MAAEYGPSETNRTLLGEIDNKSFKAGNLSECQESKCPENGC